MMPYSFVVIHTSGMQLAALFPGISTLVKGKADFTMHMEVAK